MVKKTEPKMCMRYLKSFTIGDLTIESWKKVKITQSEIDTIQEKINHIYPVQRSWISKVEKKDCNCKK